MRTPQWRFASGTLVLLLLLTAERTAQAQVAAATRPDAASAPSISVDVLVLGLPNSGLRDVGLFFPESEPGAPGNATGFAIVLPGEEASALSGNPRAIMVHRLKQQLASPGPMRLRLDARTPVNPGDSELQPYDEVGISLEVTASAVSTRGIALSTSSAVRIRRGPGSAGGLAPLLLETEPVKREVQVLEGKTILLGGFLSAADRARLPDSPETPESPLLSYVLSKTPRRGEDTEIVILLTPRRVGGMGEPEAAPAITTPAITAAPALPTPEVPETKTVTSGVTSMASLLVPKPVFASIAIPASAEPPVENREATPDIPFYTVQAGAFRSRVNADALVVELEKKFEDVFVDESAAGRAPYRVRVGRLPDAEAARQVQAKLANHGFDSFVVTPDSR